MDVPLDRLLEEYLSYCRSTKAKSTYEGNDLPRASRFVNYLESRGLQKASQITQAHVQDFQQQLTGDLSPRSVRHCMFAASGLMSFALGRGCVSSNVVRGVQKIKAEKNPPRYLSFDEQRAVLNGTTVERELERGGYSGRFDYEAEDAVKARAKALEADILSQSDLGRKVVALEKGKDNLLDTVWLATSTSQMKELWEQVNSLLAMSPTALKEKALKIAPVEPE